MSKSSTTNIKRIIVLGISGVTCGGKTTLAKSLQLALPGSKILSQDDFFLPPDHPNHTWIEELNHVNYDILSSLDMKEMQHVLETIVQNLEIVKKVNDRKADKEEVNIAEYLVNKLNETATSLLIVEGFSIFNYKPIVPMFSLKYYFTLDKKECFRRRLQRVYDPPDCEGYFEKCAWPEHLKQLEEVKRNVADVTYFTTVSEEPLCRILHDILSII